MRLILKAQDLLTRLAFVLGVCALAAIVAIYAYEVTARYLFAAPTRWGSDLVSFLLLISVFSTVPWLTREGGHVAVTILPDMAARLRRPLLTLACFAAAGACLWAAYLCIGETLYLIRRGTTTLTSVPVPKWILIAFITYGVTNSGLYFLRLGFRGGEPIQDTPSEPEVTHG